MATFFKIVVIIIIFLGEATAIYAEVHSARAYAGSWKFFFNMALILIASSFLLLLGYVLGLQAFKEIWIVSVTSFTTILIVEPIMDFVVFKSVPSQGSLIGLVLGGLGLIAALFF